MLVMQHFLTKDIWTGILNLFMKENSHSNAMIVMQGLIKQNMSGNINYGYEGKKPFKYNICDSSFSQNILNRHVWREYEVFILTQIL